MAQSNLWRIRRTCFGCLGSPTPLFVRNCVQHTKLAKKSPEAIGPTSLSEIAFRHAKLAKKVAAKKCGGIPWQAHPPVTGERRGRTLPHTSAHFRALRGVWGPPRTPRKVSGAHFRTLPHTSAHLPGALPGPSPHPCRTHPPHY